MSKPKDDKTVVLYKINYIFSQLEKFKKDLEGTLQLPVKQDIVIPTNINTGISLNNNKNTSLYVNSEPYNINNNYYIRNNPYMHQPGSHSPYMNHPSNNNPYINHPGNNNPRMNQQYSYKYNANQLPINNTEIVNTAKYVKRINFKSMLFK